MKIYDELTKIASLTTQEFDNENYDIDVFQRMAFEYSELKDIPEELLEATPLADFEKKVREFMDSTGFDYKLELVAMPATCDGGCFEPYYYLCWYDNGIKTVKFNFSTVY